MKKQKVIDEILGFVNYHDGGYLEPYVAHKLIDFLVEDLGMLPPKTVNPKVSKYSSYEFYSLKLKENFKFKDEEYYLNKWESDNES
tara:strand:+ start:358 stop:615 length:258 start_codon:yes stop_codon:yes gene_type:complete